MLDTAIIAPENLLATSPSGEKTAVPTSVVKVEGEDIWNYVLSPDRSEPGLWKVTLNSDRFSLPKGTILGTIDVSPGTLIVFSMNWGSLETVQQDIAILKNRVESDPVAAIAVTALDTKVDGLITIVNDLPTNAAIAPVKTAVSELQTKYAALETEKASATSVATANEAIAAVKTALDTLAALAPDVSQAELDAAIAAYQAADTKASDAIAAVKKSSDDSASSLTTAVSDIAQLKTDLASVKKTADGAATKTALADVKAIADAAGTKASVDALTARVAALEAIDNDDYLVSGSPFMTSVAMGLRSLVYIMPDGRVGLADSSDPTKAAVGMIDGAATAGASVKIYGTGSKWSSVGISGLSNGSRLFLGTGGGFTLSSTGTGKLVQGVGIWKNGNFWADFSDVGYFVEAE